MEENEGKPNNRRKRIAAFITFPLLIVIGAVVLFFYREYKATHISTMMLLVLPLVLLMKKGEAHGPGPGMY